MLIVFLFFFILIVSSIGGKDDEVKVKDGSILHITLDQPVMERANENDFNFDPTSFQADKKLGLNQFISDLHKAAGDDRIKGVFLEFKSILAAPSTMLDLRAAIRSVRDSGKWVVAYSESYSQGGYYLASAADEVYLYPQGNLDWRGINAEITFYKKLLDKLGIEAQIIRGPDNKFKSAVEPFMYDHMSPENKAQMSDFIGDIWRIMLESIADDRGKTVAELMGYADSLAFSAPGSAVEAGLLDGLKYRDEVMDIMAAKLGTATAADADSTESKHSSPPMVSLEKYHKAKGGKKEKSDFGKDRVAIVYAVGAIESGQGNDQTIGSDRIAAALKKAREDDKVKAIVLRVNSPGGSALASDVIWRETQLIKKSGKPLVVSMGDLAASGGYYISCSADKIFANANTITGSIGVFGIIPNMEKFFDDKLGITFDRIETNPHADVMSINKPMDEAEKKFVQDMIVDIYTNFTTIVADGRGMTVAAVDSIGQGRVWSGEDGVRLGLVDEIGDLNTAVKAAAEMANITDYGIKELPALIDPIQQMIEELTGQKQTKMLKEMLGDEYAKFEMLREVAKWKGVQARMPFDIVIR